MTKKILVLVPHPDDAEFYAGGSMALFAQQDAVIQVVIATNGNKGSFILSGIPLIHQRREETAKAAQVLGILPPILLDHPDFELDRLPPCILREQFIRLIRQFKPDMVIAEDPFAPLQVHPDHRATAWAANDAVFFSALPNLHPEHLEEGLSPHFVIEKLFFSESPSGANHLVDITQTIEHKIRALAAHRSQMEFLVDDFLRQAQLAGLDLSTQMSGMNDPVDAIAYAVKTQAAMIGQSAGMQFAEAFRYARFHPYIESLIPNQ